MEEEDYIKKQVRIFLDENINPFVKNCLRDLGFKKVANIYDSKLKGSSDGKVLDFVKQNNAVLVTYDKKFHKMCLRFNCKSILLEPINQNQQYGAFKTSRVIEEKLNI